MEWELPGFSVVKRKQSENTETKTEYCKTEMEMEQRFPVEQPWKQIREYETFCFYHVYYVAQSSTQ